jgi:hypothetical protein
MTHFFRIVDREEDLKYEYGCLGWNTVKSGRNVHVK